MGMGDKGRAADCPDVTGMRGFNTYGVSVK